MSDKSSFISTVQNDITLYDNLVQRLRGYRTSYFSNGWDSGGSSPIIDTDGDEFNVTALELGAAMTMTEQITKFVDNAAVTQGDYQSTINGVRKYP